MKSSLTQVPWVAGSSADGRSADTLNTTACRWRILISWPACGGACVRVSVWPYIGGPAHPPTTTAQPILAAAALVLLLLVGVGRDIVVNVRGYCGAGERDKVVQFRGILWCRWEGHCGRGERDTVIQLRVMLWCM